MLPCSSDWGQATLKSTSMVLSTVPDFVLILGYLGFWENNTYGVYALYKSDWTVVGGFNINMYTKWGGEDWDILDRLALKTACQFQAYLFVLPYFSL